MYSRMYSCVWFVITIIKIYHSNHFFVVMMVFQFWLPGLCTSSSHLLKTSIQCLFFFFPFFFTARLGVGNFLLHRLWWFFFPFFLNLSFAFVQDTPKVVWDCSPVMSSEGHNSSYWHKNLPNRVWLHDMLTLRNDQKPAEHGAVFQLSSEGHNSTYWHKN